MLRNPSPDNDRKELVQRFLSKNRMFVFFAAFERLTRVWLFLPAFKDILNAVLQKVHRDRSEPKLSNHLCNSEWNVRKHVFYSGFNFETYAYIIMTLRRSNNTH